MRFSWTIVASCVAGTMPITHNVDIKLSFEMFDMTPGQSGRAFRRSLLLHGGKSDAHGFSYAWGVDSGVSADGGARGKKGSIWGVLEYAGVAR